MDTPTLTSSETRTNDSGNSVTTRGIPIHEYIREHAQKRPNSLAINFYGQQFTYSWLDTATDRLAAYLLSCGIHRGDRVALYMQNSPQYIVAHFAIQKIGATATPCNPMFKEWELEFELNDAGAKAIILLDELYDRFAAVQRRTGVDLVLVSSVHDFLPATPSPSFPASDDVRSQQLNDDDNLVNLVEVIEDATIDTTVPGIHTEVAMSDDVSLIMYTSGTTGKPKGAMLTFENVEFKTACVVKNYELTPDDQVLAAMPIFHIAGMLVGMNAALMAGAGISLVTRFDAEAMLQILKDQQVTFSYTTPIMNIQTMEAADEAPNTITSLRCSIGTSFGLQVTETLSKRWEAFAGVPLIEFAYGMSETHTADAMQSLRSYRWGSVGKPTYDTEIEIRSLDDRNKRVPVGESGEIVVRSRSVFKGYFDRDEESRKAKVDGWYFSGDVGHFDEDGFLYFEGRNKEMIKSNGYSVFPEEVEEMVARHPDVETVAVIGIPDAKRGESVLAFVVRKRDAKVTEQELIAWCREHMAAYKYPRAVRFVDSLPQTATGKLLRRILRDQIDQENTEA